LLSLVVILLSLPLLALTRPTGFFYWPLALVYLVAIPLARISPIWKTVVATAFLLLSLYLVDQAMGSGGELDFMLPFREEHVICGSPTLLHPRDIPVRGSGNSIFSLLYYIGHDFGRFLYLAGLKSVSFWGVVRDYYSRRHNLCLVVYFYPVIIASVIAVSRRKTRLPFLPLICLAIPVLVTWVAVILTCDDWSNRFFLGITPFLMLLASPLVAKWLTALRRDPTS
jgi:hypothetical protein